MASKKGARYLSLTVPLWDTLVHAIEAPSIAEAAKEARRRWPDLDITTRDVERADGMCLVNAAEEPVILLPVGATAGVVAHECFHATNYVLKNAGVLTSVSNDETTAYTLQAIVDAVAPWLTSRKRVHPSTQPAAKAPAPAQVKPPEEAAHQEPVA